MLTPSLVWAYLMRGSMAGLFYTVRRDRSQVAQSAWTAAEASLSRDVLGDGLDE